MSEASKGLGSENARLQEQVSSQAAEIKQLRAMLEQPNNRPRAGTRGFWDPTVPLVGDHGGQKKPNQIRLSFLEKFFLSGTAAVAAKTVACPLESYKLCVQIQPEADRMGLVLQPFSAGSLFWGNLHNCARYFPTQLLNLAFGDRIKALFKPAPGESGGMKKVKNILAGGCSGGVMMCFTYPLDVWRIQASLGLPLSPLRDSYSGFGLSVAGIFVYRALYVGLYDTIMPMLGRDVRPGAEFGAGYGVVVTAGVVTYPIDTVRRRMMLNPSGYPGALACAQSIVATEGPKNLFIGAGYNILRGIIGALVLMHFDEVKHAYVAKMYGVGNRAQ